MYVYYSHVKCICQYWMYMYWCYIIIYGKVRNILGVILKYNNNVIIYELVNVLYDIILSMTSSYHIINIISKYIGSST